MTETIIKSDVIVIGGGPVGLFASIMLARQGVRVHVLEGKDEASWSVTPPDGREIALTHGSIRMLEEIGFGEHVPQEMRAPLRQAQIETAHAQEPLLFSPWDSSDQDAQELGWLVPNYRIRNALFALAKATEDLTLCANARVEAVTDRDAFRIVRTNHATCEAPLVIAADGRFSKVRAMAGIGEIIHDFHRYVLVCPMKHTKPHNHIALQWFDEGQTVAFLPLQGDVSSLVLILPKDEIMMLMSMSQADFNEAITLRTQERLGKMSVIGDRQAYPLKAVFAHRFAAHRLALIGDAAVGMNPITAHGFNLGLKGAQNLAQYVMENLLHSGDAGDSKGLRAFERRHRLDTIFLFAGTNFIATLYGRDENLATKLRQFFLKAANATPPFRRMVTDMLMDGV